MKKKIFSTLAALMIIFSASSFNNTTDDDSSKCEDRAYNVMHQAYNAGYNDEDVTWFMNVAYALCEGYSWDDIK